LWSKVFINYKVKFYYNHYYYNQKRRKMKEILDTIVLIGFVYILFIFIRGMNDTQVQKHQKRLEENEEKNSDTKSNEKQSKE